jgi:exodeoxyribonuclease VII small subunit
MADTNYQELHERLEMVLDKLQASGVRVDEAVLLYEEGLKLIASLEKQLKQAENKIEKLKLQSK